MFRQHAYRYGTKMIKETRLPSLVSRDRTKVIEIATFHLQDGRLQFTDSLSLKHQAEGLLCCKITVLQSWN